MGITSCGVDVPVGDDRLSRTEKILTEASQLSRQSSGQIDEWKQQIERLESEVTAMEVLEKTAAALTQK